LISTALCAPTLPNVECTSSGRNGIRSPLRRYVFDAFWSTHSTPNFRIDRISPPLPRETPRMSLGCWLCGSPIFET
jgi:hypothetical protein